MFYNLLLNKSVHPHFQWKCPVSVWTLWWSWYWLYLVALHLSSKYKLVKAIFFQHFEFDSFQWSFPSALDKDPPGCWYSYHIPPVHPCPDAKNNSVSPNPSSRCGDLLCFNFFSAWVNIMFFLIQMSFEDNGSLGFANDSELNPSWVCWLRQTHCYAEMKAEEWRRPPGSQARATRYGHKWLISSSALSIQGADAGSLDTNGPTDFERSTIEMFPSARWDLWYGRKTSKFICPNLQSKRTKTYVGEGEQMKQRKSMVLAAIPEKLK